MFTCSYLVLLQNNLSHKTLEISHKQAPFDSGKSEKSDTGSGGQKYSKIQAINPAAGRTSAFSPFCQHSTASPDAGPCCIVQKWCVSTTFNDKAVYKWQMQGTYGSSEFISLRMAELEGNGGWGFCQHIVEKLKASSADPDLQRTSEIRQPHEYLLQVSIYYHMF